MYFVASHEDETRYSAKRVWSRVSHSACAHDKSPFLLFLKMRQDKLYLWRCSRTITLFHKPPFLRRFWKLNEYLQFMRLLREAARQGSRGRYAPRPLLEGEHRGRWGISSLGHLWTPIAFVGHVGSPFVDAQ